MKIVIDISEETYQDVIKNGFIYDEDSEVISHAMINGIPIPENATNGDVIKTLFPKCMWNATGQDEEWWNAPYERKEQCK